MGTLRDNVERWLIHANLKFGESRSAENTFIMYVRHAGPSGVPMEVFEPAAQPGILVVGAKVVMRNSQVARYRSFTGAEQDNFITRVAEFCRSIGAVSRQLTEDGKQKTGVYVVLDDPEAINQETLFEAIQKVAALHEKTAKFIMKTF